jgi:hypothetical protein
LSVYLEALLSSEYGKNFTLQVIIVNVGEVFTDGSLEEPTDINTHKNDLLETIKQFIQSALENNTDFIKTIRQLLESGDFNEVLQSYDYFKQFKPPHSEPLKITSSSNSNDFTTNYELNAVQLVSLVEHLPNKVLKVGHKILYIPNYKKETNPDISQWLVDTKKFTDDDVFIYEYNHIGENHNISETILEGQDAKKFLQILRMKACFAKFMELKNSLKDADKGTIDDIIANKQLNFESASESFLKKFLTLKGKDIDFTDRSLIPYLLLQLLQIYLSDQNATNFRYFTKITELLQDSNITSSGIKEIIDLVGQKASISSGRSLQGTRNFSIPSYLLRPEEASGAAPPTSLLQAANVAPGENASAGAVAGANVVTTSTTSAAAPTSLLQPAAPTSATSASNLAAAPTSLPQVANLAAGANASAAASTSLLQAAANTAAASSATPLPAVAGANVVTTEKPVVAAAPETTSSPAAISVNKAATEVNVGVNVAAAPVATSLKPEDQENAIDIFIKRIKRHYTIEQVATFKSILNKFLNDGYDDGEKLILFDYMTTDNFNIINKRTQISVFIEGLRDELRTQNTGFDMPSFWNLTLKSLSDIDVSSTEKSQEPLIIGANSAATSSPAAAPKNSAVPAPLPVESPTPVAAAETKPTANVVPTPDQEVDEAFKKFLAIADENISKKLTNEKNMSDFKSLIREFFNSLTADQKQNFQQFIESIISKQLLDEELFKRFMLHMNIRMNGVVKLRDEILTWFKSILPKKK